MAALSLLRGLRQSKLLKIYLTVTLERDGREQASLLLSTGGAGRHVGFELVSPYPTSSPKEACPPVTDFTRLSFFNHHRLSHTSSPLIARLFKILLVSSLPT